MAAKSNNPENNPIITPVKAKPAKAVKSVAKNRSSTPAVDVQTEEKLPEMKSLNFVTRDFKELNNADADKAINDVRQAGRMLKRKAHITACGIMMHYVKHGDYTKMNLMLDAVQEGMSRAMRKGLVDWVLTFSSLEYSDATKRFVHKKGTERFFLFQGDVNSPEGSHQFNGAMNTPFWSTSFGDKPFRPFDFEAYIKNVVKTIEREWKRKAEASGDHKRAIKITKDQVRAVEGLAHQFNIDIADMKTVGNA